jgi:hypothetical protein
VSASGAIDAIRERFGTAAIGPASTVSPGPGSARGLRVVRTGAQQWGPDQQPPPTDEPGQSKPRR